MKHEAPSRSRAALLIAVAAILTATAIAQLDPDEPIDIELKQASLVETLQSFASINGSQLDIDPAIDGSVTIALKRTPWREVLDRICTDHQLECELQGGEPPVMRVRRIEGVATRDMSPQDETGVPASVETLSKQPAGADDRLLSVRFLTPGAPDAIEGTARFNWATPLRAFDSGTGDGERWQVRLSWLSFGPELDLVAPAIVRCGEEDDAELLDLLRLPLAGPIERGWRGAVVELSSPETDEASFPGLAQDFDCVPSDSTSSQAGGPGILTTFRQTGDTAREFELELELELDAQPGNFLLMTTPGAEPPTAPAAALLALGAGPAGLSVAIIRPADGTPPFRVDRRTIAAGSEAQERIATPDGSEYELRLRAIE